MEDNELRITRDKAYTFMKMAVDEIRRHGQYVFWKNAQRHKGYISKYHKKQAAKAAKPKTETETTAS